jgi:hypothetical protein
MVGGGESGGPVEQAAADVSALLGGLAGLRIAVEVAERAATDLIDRAQACRDRMESILPDTARPSRGVATSRRTEKARAATRSHGHGHGLARGTDGEDGGAGSSP